jgi:hypothetical protein
MDGLRLYFNKTLYYSVDRLLVITFFWLMGHGQGSSPVNGFIAKFLKSLQIILSSTQVVSVRLHFPFLSIFSSPKIVVKS